MVPVKYNGVERSRLMALKSFRDELLAIESAYRPFHPEFRAVHAVIQSLDGMMEVLIGDREAFWRKP
jgi:hypothetical protein